MRNDAWAEFVGIREDQRAMFTTLMARYLSGLTDERMVGRLAGALHMLSALPYAGSAEDDLHFTIEKAHHVNRRAGRPCGCGTRKRCHLDGVDLDALRATLAQSDPGLRLETDAGDEWWDDDDDED